MFAPSPIEIIQAFVTLFAFLVLIIGFIVMVVARWKEMRASQSIAESLKSIAGGMNKPEDQA